MEFNAERFTAPVKSLLQEAHQVGKAAIGSLNSQQLAENLIELQEQKEIDEAFALKTVGEFISEDELVTHQTKVIAHLTVKGIVRRSHSGKEVCEEDVNRLKYVMRELPPDESLDTLALQDEEVAEIHQYLRD